MKHIYQRIIMLVVLFACISNIITAQSFHVIDANKSKDANPTNNTIFDGYDWGHSDTYYAILNGVAYFSADDGIHGAEFWRSDGTSQGTYMIQDIIPGTSSSNIRDITVSGSKLFFSATNGSSVQTIWVSDGTAQGTQMIIDLGSSGAANPTYLTDVNGVLYFFTDDFFHGTTASQLWKTDGTANGTVLVADFYNNFNSSSQGRQITNVNGHIFFSIQNYGWAPELAYSDGTTAGTVILNSINPYGYGSNPTYLTSLNGAVYFSADDGSGLQLWVSDGTMSGTHKINNANNIYLDGDGVYHFQKIKNVLYFTGYSSDGYGPELCKYDPSNASNNVELVKAINTTPGAFVNNMYNFVSVNNNIFFSVYNGSDQTLWKTDGTAAGTAQVKDINPGGHNVYLFKHMMNANGSLLFSFYDDQNGYELWKSNGTSQGTQIVKEINPGVYSAWITNISYLGRGVSLFEAYDGKTGFELWRTDGTAQGTWMVKNINQSSTASSNPVWLTPSPDNRSLLFAAYDPEYGHEMRITDGTDAGTHVIKDIYKGSFDSWPYLPANYKNATYFFANIDNPVPRQDHGSDIFLVSRLWKTDGTEKGTSMISVPSFENLINDSGYVENPPSGPVATENLLYLIIFNNTTYQQELWRTDGTTAGTYAVKTDINPWYAITATPVGKYLYFMNYNVNTYSLELWVTDGTSAGTKAVSLNGASYPQNLFAFKQKLYFSAYDPVNFYEDLWVVDGSFNASMVKSLYVASWIPFAQANGKMFFTANDFNTTAGYELWESDGTPQGTKMVKDIFPQSYASSFPSMLTGTGSLLFFTATDSAHGYELWESDGTSRGTKLVKDITPGIDGSYGISNLTGAGNQLYFLNYGSLWTTDGTSYGTNSVSDPSLNGMCCIANMVMVGNKLAFTGSSYTYGSEIWMGSAACGFAQDNSISTKMEPTATEETIATTAIYPNPANDILNIRIASSADSRISITLTDINGTPLITKVFSAEQTTLQLNVANLASGVYFVKIISTNSSENVVKKFVKL
ncbi:MAG TPA: ELWxxDGT repeat protein [Puia sp.]|nr:ELWxxDGT repeat protein [Puia sp.]